MLSLLTFFLNFTAGASCDPPEDDSTVPVGNFGANYVGRLLPASKRTLQSDERIELWESYKYQGTLMKGPQIDNLRDRKQKIYTICFHHCHI